MGADLAIVKGLCKMRVDAATSMEISRSIVHVFENSMNNLSLLKMVIAAEKETTEFSEMTIAAAVLGNYSLLAFRSYLIKLFTPLKKILTSQKSYEVLFFRLFPSFDRSPFLIQFQN